LFEHPTIAGLSRQLELMKQEESGTSMPPLLPINLELYRWDAATANDSVASPDTFIVPVSFAQQRLWVLGQLDPDNAAYNIPAAVRISGLLNAATLQMSLNEVGLRHASLRTKFAYING